MKKILTIVWFLQDTWARVVAWIKAAPRNFRSTWQAWPRKTRIRFLSGTWVVVCFIVYYVLSGVTRYIVFCAGIGFLLCIALPGIPGGLLELLGFRLGRVRDRSGWATAQSICEGSSVGLVGVLVCVYSVYLVSNQGSLNVPGIGSFSVIVTSFALGALMITAANNSTIDNVTRDKALMAAQKLIIAGVMLGLFAVFFMVFDSIFKSLGGVDPAVLDFSGDGWKRGLSFWLQELTLVIGGLLFAVAIVEVVFVLREIRVIRRRR
jgi:hypothetical protein